MKHNKKIFPVPGLGLATALLITACGAAPGTQTPTQSATIDKGSIMTSVNANGTIQAKNEAKMTFQVSGIVAAVKVGVGDAVERGDVLASLDTADAELALRKASAALEEARIARIIAQTHVTRTLEGPKAADMAAAGAALKAATDNYAKVAAGPMPADIAAAKARIANAEAALKRAQFGYDNAFRQDPAAIGASPEALQLEQATNDYTLAKADYDRAVQPADAAQLSAARQQIASAKAQLNTARQGAKPYDVERSEAELAQAGNRIEQAALDVAQAERKLQQMQITAPFDGVVSAVDIKVGETAGAAPAITLVDVSALRIDINVDEIDVAHIRVNQAVTVRLDALPSLALTGTIEQIAPTSKVVNGVVSYPVKVVLPSVSQPLKPGMTANTRIVLDKREGVLVVPNWAIRRDAKSGQTFLTVPAPSADGSTAEPSIKEIEVTLGLKDETATEVLSGAAEGQAILAPAGN